MKQRISWKKQTAQTVEIDNTVCNWSWVRRSSYREEPIRRIYVGFEWDDWYLSWESLQVDKFTSEETLKCYIIRFTYNIDDKYAIPSELLRNAGMRYRSGIWVDEWFASNSNHALESNVVNFSVQNPEWVPDNKNLCFRNETSKRTDISSPTTTNLDPDSHFDRGLCEFISGPGFIPIALDWEDSSWESRPGKSLCQNIPKVESSDSSCITILTAEVGFGTPKQKTAKKSEKT